MQVEEKMNQVTFPAFNFIFHINKIAIHIGNSNIYWYAIFIVVSIIVALLFCKKNDGKYGISFQTILEIFVIVLPIAILSARFYYVLFRLDYYLKYPIKILAIQDGGLAIYGGIIGGVITIYVYCKKKRINVLDVLDYIAPYLALGQAIGRWGNFFNVEAYGIETKSLFRMGIIENGRYIEVHPTFLYESIGNFFLFLILYYMGRKREYKGQITYFYFIGYGLLRFVIEGLRSDSLMLGNLKISQILSALFVIILVGRKLKVSIKK